MGNSRITRTAAIGAPLTAAAAVLALTTVPAHAADEITATIASGITLPTAVSADDDHLDRRRLDVGFQARVAGEGDFVVTYDTGGLAGIAAFAPGGPAYGTFPNTCVQQGTTYVCTGHQAAGGTGFTYRTTTSLTPLVGAPQGRPGHLRITRTWKSGPAVTTDVAVYSGGPRLEVTAGSAIPSGPLNALGRFEPGSAVTQKLKVTNNGNLPSGRLVVALTVSPGLEFTQKYANCSYGTYKSSLPYRGTGAAICTVNTSVQPGRTVTLDPVTLGFGSDVVHTDFQVVAAGNEQSAHLWMRDLYDFTPASGTGPRYTAGLPEEADTVPGPPNIAYSDAEARHERVLLGYDTSARAELVPSGSWAATDAGAKGTLTVRIRNTGAGALGYVIDNRTVASILVRLNANTTALGPLPEGCWMVSDRNTVVCDSGPWLAGGGEASFDLKLAFEDPTEPNAANLVLTGPSSASDDMDIPIAYDGDYFNNRTTVKLLGTEPPGPTPSAGASASASASTSASPSTEPSDSASPGAGASDSAAPSASPAPSTSTASTTPVTTGEDSSTGGLAFTGASGLGATAAAGAAVTALGGGLVLTGRRRRAGAHR